MISRDVRNAPKPAKIAGEIGLSLSQFYNLFRKDTGTVPAKYIRTLRYEKARELLVNSQLSVKEITGLVGVCDVSHFVRDFRKFYGSSPGDFRRAHRAV